MIGIGNNQLMKSNIPVIPIDVGILYSPSNSFVSGYTWISLANPANESGLITTVEFKIFTTAMTGCRIGIFRLVSGTTYTCVSSTLVGDFAPSTSPIITGLSLAIEAGDYIGAYYTSGAMRCITSGGAGIVRLSGNYVTTGSSATYALFSTYGLTLIGTN